MELFEKLKNKKIISFDAETDGLWGDAFCIAAVKYDNKGDEVASFIGRCKAECKNQWVIDNVLPKIKDIPVTYKDYESLLKGFFEWYMRNKEDTAALVHMGHIVESKLLQDAHKLDIIGDWDAPFLWYDVCLFFDESIDNYIKQNEIDIEYTGSAHNPFYDSIAAYRAFRHLIENN